MDETKVALVLSGAQNTINQYKIFRNEFEAQYAFDFNPLVHFYNSNETSISKIISFFLDPSKEHGQKNLFLDILLEEWKLKEKVGTYSEVKVALEFATDAKRRIDIMLNFDNNRFCIAIENKVWAADQPAQIKHYCEFLDKKFNGKYCLIYLTAYNTKPSETSIDKGSFDELVRKRHIKSFDYSTNMIKLTDLWLEKCKADKVRNFIREFKELIYKKVNGNITMNETDLLIEYISADRNRLEVALAINASFSELNKALNSNLHVQLKNVANNHNLELITFTISNVKSNPWPSIAFDLKDNLPNCQLIFEWNSPNLTDGRWGFALKKNTVNENDSIKDRLTQLFEASNIVHSWLWAHSFDEYLNYYPKLILDIPEGVFANKIDKIIAGVIAKLQDK